jgi:gluconokinase
LKSLSRPAILTESYSGKSTVGKELSDALGIPFKDGDDLHSPASIEKMSKGIPLTDEVCSLAPRPDRPGLEHAQDRWPWLHAIRAEAARLTADESVSAYRQRGSSPDPRPAVVIACSALKLVYRELLRGHPVEGTGAPSRRREEHSDVQTYFVFRA